MFEGQHPAIIQPETSEAVQAQLQTGAAKSRSKATVTRRSRFCGKLFDETGDRLTPSHSKTKQGVRPRSCLSHRLVAKSGEAHLDAWRLPAAELESRMIALLRKLLPAPGFATQLLPDATTDQIGKAASALAEVGDKAEPDALFSLITRIDVEPGKLDLHLSADAPVGIDEALIRNIAKDQVWFARIRASESFSDIAETESASKRRIQQIVGLAFLAPDIIRDVMDGRQPTGLTFDWCLRRGLPTDWTKQRQMIAAL